MCVQSITFTDMTDTSAAVISLGSATLLTPGAPQLGSERHCETDQQLRVLSVR